MSPFVFAGSLLLIALVAGTAITMVSKVSSWRQRFQATAGAQMYKHSIFEYVTGNYLAAQYCQVSAEIFQVRDYRRWIRFLNGPDSALIAPASRVVLHADA